MRFTSTVITFSIIICTPIIFLIVVPFLFPEVMSPYLLSSDLRAVGSFDVYSLIIIQIFLLRLYMLRKHSDSESMYIILRTNAFSSLFVAFMVFVFAELSILQIIILSFCVISFLVNIQAIVRVSVNQPKNLVVWSGPTIIFAVLVLRVSGVLTLGTTET